MTNPTITLNSTGSVLLRNGIVGDNELLTLAGAGTIAAGTILARDSVSKKLVLYVPDGTTNENSVPKAILQYEVVATGAGDVPVRPLIGGEVCKERLVIDEDGDASNVDKIVEDLLRQVGFAVKSVTELAQYDNYT